jgi:hypothetical protein
VAAWVAAAILVSASLSPGGQARTAGAEELARGGTRSRSVVAAEPRAQQQLLLQRRRSMDEVVTQAAASSGQQYLALEGELRRGGPDAMAALRRWLADPDPVTRLMATVLLAWMEGRAPDCQGALEYLDAIERRLAKTPVGNPPPVGVAAELADRFGPRAAECLALRLVKETDWPHWRVMGVLFYLRDQRVPATTSGLVRFAATTPNEAWQKAAVEAIEAIQDPDLSGKLDLERRRLALTGRNLPDILRALAQ